MIHHSFLFKGTLISACNPIRCYARFTTPGRDSPLPLTPLRDDSEQCIQAATVVDAPDGNGGLDDVEIFCGETLFMKVPSNLRQSVTWRFQAPFAGIFWIRSCQTRLFSQNGLQLSSFIISGPEDARTLTTSQFCSGSQHQQVNTTYVAGQVDRVEVNSASADGNTISGLF